MQREGRAKDLIWAQVLISSVKRKVKNKTLCLRQELDAISKEPVLFLCRNSSMAGRQVNYVGYLADM